MNNRYPNLDISKINLLYVVSSFGYELDTKEGKRPLIFRRKTDNGKVAIYQNPNNQLFLNLRDSSKGDAIQFVQNELNCDFIRAKEYISSITDTNIKNVEAEPKQQATEYKSHDHWQKKYESTQPASNNHYLANDRGLLPELLENCKDIRVSRNGTPLFFNRDSKGFLTGCEYRKPTQKAFDKGSKKSLFFANMPAPEQKYIVACESAIDALSFAQLLLFSDANLEHYLIVSHGGTLNNYQCDQVLKLAQKGEIRVILAQDNDEAGDELAARLRDYLHKQGIISKRKKPRAKDWNDQLLGK